MSKEKFFELDPKVKLNDVPKNKMETTKELTMTDEVKQPVIEIGIDETLDVVNCGIDIANSTISALEDGKITFTDAPKFFGLVFSVPKAISGINLVPAELENLNAEELTQVIEAVKTKLNVADEKAKVIAEKSIKVLYQVYDLIKTIKE